METTFPEIVDSVKSPTTALATIEQAALAPLLSIRVNLKALADKYRDVAFAMNTPSGLKAAQEARYDLRENGRYAVNRAITKFKTDANEAKRKVEALGEELVAITLPREESLDKDIKAREEEIEREKEAKRQAEAARVAKHRAVIDSIRAYLNHAQQPGMTSQRVSMGIEALDSMPLLGAEPLEEFADEAVAAWEETRYAMQSLHDRLLAAETELQRVEQQRQENERVARANAEEAARLAEARKLIEAAHEAERIRAEESARIQREQAAKVEAERVSAETAARQASIGINDPALAQHPVAIENAATWARPCTSPDAPANPVVFSGGGTSIRANGDVEMTYQPPTLKLGDIAARLGFALPGLFITQTLGFTPEGTSKQGTPLWGESAFPLICAALVEHVLKCGEAKQ